MFKIMLLIATTSAAFLEDPLCAYWCESPCQAKVVAFYCCSYEPSLTGPKEFLPPPCTSLCENRTANAPVHKRNCQTEMEDLAAAGTFKICRNFKDCDHSTHDLCCPDTCAPGVKICVKL